MPKGTPSYLTTDSQGRIGAQFTGHVHAQELDLDATNILSTPTSSINWIATSDGALTAIVSAADSAGTEYLSMVANPNNIRPLGRANLTAVNGAGLSAGVAVAAGAGRRTVFASADGNNETIIDSDGNSGFLAMGHVGQSLVGTTAVTWPGGTTAYQAPTITLPFTPAGVVASAVNTNSVGQVLITPIGVTNGIVLFLTEVPANVVPANTVTYVSWIAWT